MTRRSAPLHAQPRLWLRALQSLLVLVFVAACATLPASSSSIVKSPNDARVYRAITLDNGLVTVLVSDPATDKSAAALTVFRGSYDDPKDRPGLAHFLEHMLFLGTAKYPEIDAYESFITTHGGTFNAYTASDHTTYFFDIQADYLDGALDRFAQFFISPTFDAAYVEREKNAVNSEYQLYLKDDVWRAGHVEKQLMDPEYPGAKFIVGSLDTLKGDVRTDLIEFYRTHYSADQMALVVLGRQSTDDLERTVRSIFTAIPRRPIAASAPLRPMFAPGTLPTKLTYATVKDTREVSYNFPVPEIDSHYRQKPGQYIGNLLAHEGPGSLHAALKARGWIESLEGGAQRVDADNALIAVTMELTDAGAQHIDDITRALFEYIALLRTDGVARWRYAEQADVAELEFRFQEKASPMGLVYKLAPNLQIYPVKDVLEAPYLMENYDEALIRKYLDALRPDNLLLEVSAPKVDADRIEPWFQVPFAVQPLTISLSGATPGEFGLALPAPNEFLPKHLDIIAQPQSPPQRIDSTPDLTLWWAPDGSFGTPRATTYVKLDVAGGFTSPKDSAYAALYTRLVQDALNAFAYPAQLAGLDYDVDAAPSGFLITISGYNDKQPMLLERVLDAFAHLDPAQDKVAEYREELRRGWLNFASERPYEQALASLPHVMLVGGWPPQQLADALDDVSAANLAAWRSERLGRFGAVVLTHGNVDEAEARAVAHAVRSTLPLAPITTAQEVVAKLPRGEFTFPLDVVNDDAAMVLYMQGSSESFHERALFGLTGQVLRTPYFTDLRTEAQLGYVVQLSPSPLRRTPGITFIVQSPVAGPAALLDATIGFLTKHRAVLAAMPADEFASHQRGLITRLREQDKKLSDRSERYFNDLDVGFLNFDSREQIATEIERIDQPELLAFYDRMIGLAKDQRLVIYSRGRFSDVPAGAAISDVGAFRAAAGLFPSSPSAAAGSASGH